MYYIKTEQSFDAAHFLKNHTGKCHNLHGHRWRVVIELASETVEVDGPSKGMIIDFTDIKNDLKALCDYLDHAFIYEKGTLKELTIEALKSEDFRLVELEITPTAENLAKYFYDKLKSDKYPIHRVEVYETPNNMAAYEV